jgi:hypothetical protein
MLKSKCVLLSPPAQLKGLKREKIKGGERSGKEVSPNLCNMQG